MQRYEEAAYISSKSEILHKYPVCSTFRIRCIAIPFDGGGDAHYLDFAIFAIFGGEYRLRIGKEQIYCSIKPCSHHIIIGLHYIKQHSHGQFLQKAIRTPFVRIRAILLERFVVRAIYSLGMHLQSR